MNAVQNLVDRKVNDSIRQERTGQGRLGKDGTG